jgi:hypothetical protein
MSYNALEGIAQDMDLLAFNLEQATELLCRDQEARLRHQQTIDMISLYAQQLRWLANNVENAAQRYNAPTVNR